MKTSIASTWTNGESKVRVVITIPVTFKQWLSNVISKLLFIETDPELVATAREYGAKVVRELNSRSSSEFGKR